ncbi:MAG TPA: iron-sulfur cluster assembly scaffold protein [Gemmatimonadaceae bacterium]|nr:iron-sulfur cluster assembly scaffold protein [Gemmatimonadaceae bacterium]
MYSELILDHFRRPRNKGALEAPDVSHEGVHALCGDRIRIEIAIDHGRVAAARFRGDACAIATAAASLLTGMIDGREIEAAESIADETMIASLEAEVPAGRRGCALLPIQVMRRGITEWRERTRP